jgi:hypothetical protein
MKRRKTSNRVANGRYAPTYTENGSFLMLPASALTLTTPGFLTLLDLINSTKIPTANLGGVKLSSITFSLKNNITRGILSFQTGQTHVLTDILRAAKVKPAPVSFEGQWHNETNNATDSNTVLALWSNNDVQIEYIGVTVRYSQ